MPLTRFKLSAIADGGIATVDLADDAVTTAKINDGAVTLAKTDSLFVNTEISGTEAARMPVGTTAQRANAQSGDIRFNSSFNLMEYYDGVRWKSIDSPPTISVISPSTFDAAGDTITVTGSNFQTGINVTVTGSDGTTYTPDSVTRNSSSQLTFDITSAIFNGGLDAFDVTLTNTSGLAVTSADALTIPNPTAAFNESATQTIYDSQRSSGFDAGVTLTGDVSESDVTLTYALTTGSLPSGASLNTSTGAITGISAVGSDTVSNFTITATVADASEGTSVDVTRAFALTIAAPVITSYTSTGSGTFSVPSGIAAVDVLVVAGGGSAGGSGSDDTAGGGGGAGGLIYRPQFPVTPGGSVSYTVGAGGPRPATGLSGWGQIGQDSVFGGLTAKGGGGGGAYAAGGGRDGGSGGGGTTSPQAPHVAAGSGIQPQQPGDSGQSQYGFGNPGGAGSSYSPPSQGATSPNAGGGGGAGGAGFAGPASPEGGGGVGKQYDISGSQVYYAGGGAGGGGQGQVLQGGGGPGRPSGTSGNGTDGTANRGGGGGGANTHGDSTNGSGGAGGSGIVIVTY